MFCEFLNLANITQLVRVSNCGFESHGFESHYSPITFYIVCGKHNAMKIACYVWEKIILYMIDLTFVDVVWLFLFISIYWWGGLVG